MSDKMIRFLTSINISNVEDFDMDFEMIGKNRFNPDQYDMVIIKDTPWKYTLLRQFQDSLINIKYQYSLRFSYKQRPTANEVIELYKEWYQTLYRIPSTLVLKSTSEDIINVVYKSEEEKQSLQTVIQDFKDFLSFIFYEFVLMEEIDSNPSIQISEEEKLEIEKKASKVAEETQKTQTEEVEFNSGSERTAYLEKERENINKQVGDLMLEQMKQNKIAMEKERERMRINKRGNYTHIENIDSLNINSDHVDINGMVFSVETNEFKDTCKYTVGVGDDNGAAVFVTFYKSEYFNEEFMKKITKGVNVRVRGVCMEDKFTKAVILRAHYIDILPNEEIIPDEGESRVELHLHTNMSAMDGVNAMGDFVAYAKAMGHKAIGITDHAVVQNYPDAQSSGEKNEMKILYGVECYMVDEKLEFIKNPVKIPLHNAKYVVFDLETTGLSSLYNRIIEFGAVKVEHGVEVGRMDILINPGVSIPEKIQEITGITDDEVKGQPTINEVLPKIVEFIGDAILVSHNANFDVSFLQEELRRCNMPVLTNPVIDTLALSRYLFPDSRLHNLGTLCKNLEVFYDEESAHRADYDAQVLNDVWQPMIVKLEKDNPNLTHEDLAKLKTPSELLKHIKPYHVIVYAKDQIGLKNLYELISISHTDYLTDIPKVPRSFINKYREHLLIGSACFNGEVFTTARYYNNERLKEVMKFYDYIEVQPLENYSFLVNMDEMSQDELVQYIKDIVRCAEEVNKPVCATGDVHYLKPLHKRYRDIFISADGLGHTKHPLNPYSRSKHKLFENPDQHFRTTKEMLECMSFLGQEKAYEITVTNTNKIADLIEELKPLPNNVLCAPEIANCKEMLRDNTTNRAKELYGDPLPEFIEKRLNDELNGIINNGYAVIYQIAHDLVKKANDDGHIIGSRGSVGSSFVAHMYGITEVNPLPAHYRCPHCKHFEWDNSENSGFDLPDKVCPVCGTPLVHDGQNIPFQTFLGFNADKTPDIDLNIPSDYQASSHNYTKVLLGADNVFRCGEVQAVQDKTAFGYARGYLERKFISEGCTEEEAKAKVNDYPKVKVAYLASGCIDVKRTTGQHPGGIIVIPDYKNVYDFTPVQYPANNTDATWKTTHFDYHKLDKTILKLDLLGHVDPWALSMMCNLTSIDSADIPMNDKEALSLFSSPEALHIKNDYFHNKTGALGLPEFGTDFNRGILEDTKPTKFSELVIISGLSHGQHVWNGNAEDLIKSGQATLKEVIGCRDDIMTYLISMGVPNDVSFQIMEDVRNGYGLKPEFEEIMKINNVPQFYIDSCKQIKYLFPKGHACAYVTMAIRVAYFKVHYPLEYYATYFTLRSKQYDIQSMIKGEEAVINRLEEFRMRSSGRGTKMSPKEDEQEKTLYIALEMLQRGYAFKNIDIYKSDATNFIIDHENKALIPPFITIDGLGEAAAVSVIEARNEKQFTSKEDILKRSKLTSTNLKDLDALGALGNMAEKDTSQLSLFDF